MTVQSLKKTFHDFAPDFDRLVLQSIDFDYLAECTPSGKVGDWVHVLHIINTEIKNRLNGNTKVTSAVAEDYLRGLPTAVSIPFDNYEILQWLQSMGLICQDQSDELDDDLEQIAIDLYWNFCGRRLAHLISRLEDNKPRLALKLIIDRAEISPAWVVRVAVNKPGKLYSAGSIIVPVLVEDCAFDMADSLACARLAGSKVYADGLSLAGVAYTSVSSPQRLTWSEHMISRKLFGLNGAPTEAPRHVIWF